MPLPHTLFGIIGFILFSAFLVGQVIQQDASNDIQTYQQGVSNSMDQIVENENVFSFFSGNIALAVNTIGLLLTSLILFLNIMPQLPVQFLILGVLVSISFIVTVLKLLRGVWDR